MPRISSKRRSCESMNHVREEPEKEQKQEEPEEVMTTPKELTTMLGDVKGEREARSMEKKFYDEVKRNCIYSS